MATRVRVLMLSWEYPPVLVGGLGRHVWSLSTAMVRAGHDVTVVARHAPGAPIEEQLDGVRVLRAPEDPPLFPLSTPTLLSWVMAFNHGLIRAALRATHAAQFDVIHAHDWLVAQTAVTLKEQLRVPLVVTIHSTEIGRHLGWLPEEMNRRIHSMERWLGHEADRIILCSDYMRREAVHLLGITKAKIDVVPNGVDMSAWRTDPAAVHRTRRRYGDSGPLIGYAGRLVYEKGVQSLLYALPELSRRHPGLRLFIAGDGPYLAELRDLVDRLDLTRVVTFAGFLGAELPAAMAAADVMVVPSIYEPFGMIALEAAATGTPVAAAATGGLVEIIEPGRTGIMFPAGTPPALADAVSLLLGDRDGAGRMAANAKRKVASRYTWGGVVANVHGVYRTATAELLARLDGDHWTIQRYANPLPEPR